jgi:outer membrane receptor protein involved in Fe transport
VDPAASGTRANRPRATLTPRSCWAASGVFQLSPVPVLPQWYIAPYIQDDWKVSRRLTLNLGLRWDINTYPDEKYNRINRGFNRERASPVAGQIPADMLALMYPNLANLRGGLEFAGVGGNPARIGNMDWNNFQPRIGAAYQLTDRTVLRGGYGLYYTNFANNNDWIRTDGFSDSARRSSTAGRRPDAAAEPAQ